MVEVLLRPVDPESAFDIGYLYATLAERLRDPHENISHTKMPSLEEHKAFMKSEPYHKWWIACTEEDSSVGAVYVTKRNELGIWIAAHHRRYGVGTATLKAVLAHPEVEKPLYANINPLNRGSMSFFHQNGFKLIQVTYSCGGDTPAQPYKSVLIPL